MSSDSFSSALLDWYDQYGRKNLPWQHNPTPYRVWVSEIMLQQTQVATVIPYFERFMETFPTVEKMAEAELDTVLHLWTGLGYYARARNLHKTAKLVVSQHHGLFPRTVDELSELPGIGRSTAGAIISLGWHHRAVILDGNVKRVLARVHCIEGWPDQPKVQKQMWELAEQHTPEIRCGDYTQAIMDLGATLCARTKPACGLCPLQTRCEAHRQHRTGDFPGRKPAKKLPTKTTYMLMYLDEARQSVLLEKRPPTGIWGGLWSFPETVDLKDFAPQLSTQFMLDNRTMQQWDRLRHTFSHFHLDIVPVLVPLSVDAVGIMEAERFHWYALRQPSKVGLAAPVKQLLSLIAQQLSKPLLV